VGAEAGGTEPSDAELWMRARSSDPTPFGLLFERHVDRILWHCRRQVDSREEAEDLTSVVFLEAWRRRNEVVFGKHDSVLPWLLAVANNAVRNRRRTLRRHRNLLAKLPPLPSEHDHSDEVAERVDLERDGGHVLAAFRQLRPAEQDVLALCVWHDLSPADAALALGLPTGTVKSRLSRARTRLRELADREEPRGRGPDGRRLPSRRGSSSPQSA
jgi:RNA polymerase sigma factor (sigma-70 family)